MYEEIESREALQAFLSRDGKKLLLKHSTQCPISAQAFQQFQQYLMSKEHVPAALVKVIEARPISNYIADEFGIKHESPQLFLFKGDQLAWHTSHYQIRKELIEAEVNKA